MKKICSVILALAMILSLMVVFAACGKTETPAETGTSAETQKALTETAAEETETAEEAESTEEEQDLPAAGETVKIASVSVTIPEGWETKEYKEDESIEIRPEGAFIDSVEIILHNVYGDEHAKEWADNINGNYGGNCEIDSVEIGGKTFYRVKAKEDQNICFADLDDKHYVEISVMFLDWEKGEEVLSAISFD